MSEAIKVSKKEKHEELDDAIENVRNLALQAENLYDRIVGNSGPVNGSECTERDEPTLNSVLDVGPDRLRKTTEAVSTILGNIETTLF